MAITRSMRRRNETSDLSASPNSDLPMDLFFDILSRLSVKPLLRFKSVCKTWYALIENPNFIKKHHARNKLNLNPTLTSILVTRQHSMRLQSRDKNHNPNLFRNFIFKSHPRILGICEGLVWAAFCTSESFICNPTTGRICKISPFSLAKINTTIAFFGFYIEKDEYKLFTIVHSKYPSEVVIRAEVYSMSTDLWRVNDVKLGEIDSRVDGFCDQKAVAVNDVFYWGAFKNSYSIFSKGVNPYLVVNFHKKTRVFGVIKSPGFTGPTSSWQVIDLKGEVALSNCFGTSSLNLWVLNEKERSWSMKFRVEGLPASGYSVRCLGCDGNGHLVMKRYLSDNKIKLFLCNPENHAITHLPFAGLVPYSFVYLYTESLFWV